MTRRQGTLAALLACTLLAFSAAAAAADPWAELARPGVIVLFRHATAPGGGDPPGFKLDDCATPRNLDERGRAEPRGRAVRRGEVPGRDWAGRPATAACGRGRPRTPAAGAGRQRAAQTIRAALGSPAPPPPPGQNAPGRPPQASRTPSRPA